MFDKIVWEYNCPNCLKPYESTGGKSAHNCPTDQMYKYRSPTYKGSELMTEKQEHEFYRKLLN